MRQVQCRVHYVPSRGVGESYSPTRPRTKCLIPAGIVSDVLLLWFVAAITPPQEDLDTYNYNGEIWERSLQQRYH
ncbi:hypothetical protein Pmani_001100 [Petrolisthes manimaculis]|uniref:Uncharacterized protein n=1 Tax=Petrolisthes manimaculis TaxID=1843537 RepID=A0AAE1QKQ0_9EUCA|nr:hypothetical protein Pmani_001100 [Petrolisthes manimaculis]